MPLIFPYFTYNSYNLMSPNIGEHFPTSQNLGGLWPCFDKKNESNTDPNAVLRETEQFPSLSWTYATIIQTGLGYAAGE